MPVAAAESAAEPGSDLNHSPDTPDVHAEAEGDHETFDREYVESLREEAAGHRVRAKRADELARRLHTELVRGTGRLADPTDLAFDEQHVDDADALVAAVDELLRRKPHLASRRPTGSVDQGARPDEPGVSLLGLLRGR